MINQFEIPAGIILLPDTVVQYECPDCMDQEWIEDAGGIKRCHCVEEKIKAARLKSLIEQSGMMGSLRHKRFENYLPATKKQEAGFKAIKAGGSLLIVGPWGSGKTHLLAASVNESIEQGVSAALFSAPWLMKLIREDMLNGGKNQVLEKCCEVPYLAVDDLGKEKPSETVQQALFMIFDRREIMGLRTSVTSNYMPSTLASEKLDGAIIDRLVGMCRLIVLDGESYRRK